MSIFYARGYVLVGNNWQRWMRYSKKIFGIAFANRITLVRMAI